MSVGFIIYAPKEKYPDTMYQSIFGPLCAIRHGSIYNHDTFV